LINAAYCSSCGFGANEVLSECPRCGKKTKERFCPQCGYDFAGTTDAGGGHNSTVTVVHTSAYAEAARMTAEQRAEGARIAAEHKEKKTKTTWVIVLLIFLAPIGIPLMWLWMKDWHKTLKIVLSAVCGVFFLWAMIGSAMDNKNPAEATGPARQAETVTTADAEKEQAIAEAAEALEKAQADFDEKNFLAALKSAEEANALHASDEADSLIRECKDELLKRMSGLIRKEVDDMEGITWIYPKNENGIIQHNNRTTAYAYLGTSEGSAPWVRLCIGFHSGDWIFMEKIKFLSKQPDGDKTYEFSVSYDDRSTKVDGGIFEWIDKNMDLSSRSKLRDVVAKGQKTDVRFTGDDYHKDATLTDAQQKNLRLLLVYYDLLADTKNESYSDWVSEFAPD